MKICYIGSFTRLFDEEGIARSLEKLGHTVIRFEELGFTREHLDRIRDEKPDFTMFAKLKVSADLREDVLGVGKTVCWVPDLYYGLLREAKIPHDPIFRADLVCTPDGGHDKEFKASGVKHYLLRQGIYDEECFFGTPQETRFKIVFVGTKSPHSSYRQRLMNTLAFKFHPYFQWVGKHYTFEARGKNLNDLYASVPIIIGDSFYSPRYWSNRIYETLGRGGFMIHPNIEGLEEDFTYYKHFIPYDYGDMKGLFRKIEHYLTHESEREAIRMAGFEHVKSHHTLLHRCKQLTDYLNEHLLG